MPDKPLWLVRLPEAIERLESSSDPWVDRNQIEQLLGVGRRRAQQILSTVASREVGSSRVARAADVIGYLQRIAAGEVACYDAHRRKQLWDQLGRQREKWLEQPPVLVDVSGTTIQRVQRRDIDGLPEGVSLSPGNIFVSFTTPEEALEKLVALALAISRNREAFEERVRVATQLFT
ncbi:MAG TPA: hypothetical protein VEX68_00255 [Bryobacteraceae bacterium]|nr:hypothetical protein [Bryobacteraceae bacterium]